MNPYSAPYQKINAVISYRYKYCTFLKVVNTLNESVTCTNPEDPLRRQSACLENFLRKFPFKIPFQSQPLHSFNVPRCLLQNHCGSLHLTHNTPFPLGTDRNVHFCGEEYNRCQRKADKCQFPSNNQSPNDTQSEHANRIGDVSSEPTKDMTHFFARVDDPRGDYGGLSIIP